MLHLPAFIISIDQEKFQTCTKQLHQAGFSNVLLWSGVNGRNESELTQAWHSCVGVPLFDQSDQKFITNKGKQGCLLAHMTLWKAIIEQHLAMVHIFEDDVVFHREWFSLHDHYWNNTPQDYHLLYMGGLVGFVRPIGDIIQCSTACLHAYTITFEGAQRLVNLMVNRPAGFCTIDLMLCEFFNKNQIISYTWNCESHLDPLSLVNVSQFEEMVGLVFQDPTNVSTIGNTRYGYRHHYNIHAKRSSDRVIIETIQPILGVDEFLTKHTQDSRETFLMKWAIENFSHPLASFIHVGCGWGHWLLEYAKFCRKCYGYEQDQTILQEFSDMITTKHLTKLIDVKHHMENEWLDQYHHSMVALVRISYEILINLEHMISLLYDSKRPLILIHIPSLTPRLSAFLNIIRYESQPIMGYSDEFLLTPQVILYKTIN